MKILTQLVFLLACSAVMTYAQVVNDLALPFGGQRIIAPAGLKTAKEGNRIYILLGKEDQPSGKNPTFYGFHLGGKGDNLLSRTIIELRDVSGDRVVRNITLGEVFGKESDKWKALPNESSQSGEKIVSAYSFTALGQRLKFYRTMQIVPDEHVPTGKGISLIFAIACEKPMELSMRLIGECDGSFNSEGNSCILGDALNDKESRAMMVLNVNGTASVTPEGKQKKGEPHRFLIKSVPVKLVADQQTMMIALTIAGTTVGQQEYAQMQAHNIATYFTTQLSKPDLVAITDVDRRSTNPGDTVGYTISYHNIGTASAKDVTLDNPVPSGTRYVENTVGEDGGTASLTRSAENVVTAIQWKFETPILPGEYRSVRFKIVVQ